MKRAFGGKGQSWTFFGPGHRSVDRFDEKTGGADFAIGFLLASEIAVDKVVSAVHSGENEAGHLPSRDMVIAARAPPHTAAVTFGADDDTICKVAC